MRKSRPNKTSALPLAAGLLVACLGALPCRRAQGQGFEGARLLGAAEAQRALANTNDAIYVNPGGIALGNMYALELGYLDDLRGSDRRLNASILDSQAGPISGGIAYTYMKRRPDDVPSGNERFTGHRVEIALGTRIFDTAAIGVTGRYLHFNRKLDGEELKGRNLRELTLDAGAQWRIIGGLSVGVVGYNLTNSKKPEVPIGWGAGLGYALDALSVEADIRYNAQIGKAVYQGTLGYVIGQVAPVRLGVSYDVASEALSLSGGLGFVSSSVSLDVGYRQRVTGPRLAPDDDARILGFTLGGHMF